jgi:hypothetical protein
MIAPWEETTILPTVVHTGRLDDHPRSLSRWQLPEQLNKLQRTEAGAAESEATVSGDGVHTFARDRKKAWLQGPNPGEELIPVRCRAGCHDWKENRKLSLTSYAKRFKLAFSDTFPTVR